MILPLGSGNAYITNNGLKPCIGIIVKESQKMETIKPRKKLDKAVEEDLIAEEQRLHMKNEYFKKFNDLVQERIALEKGKNCRHRRIKA